MRRWIRFLFSGFGDVDSAMQWALAATFAWLWVAFGGTLSYLVIIQWGFVILACLISSVRSMRNAS